MWRISHLHRRTKSEATLDGELKFHLQMEIEENLRQGMSPEEARRQALIALGGLEQTREACRQACGIRWATELWQDLRYGSRMMLNNPGFNTVAILTLALGIGANTAIFTVVNTLLLRPLPYHDPDRLVWVTENESLPKSEMIPGPHFFEWRARSKALEQIAAFGGGTVTLSGAGDSERLDCGKVTASFFETLGVQPLAGRFFAAEEDLPDRNRVVVISRGLWQRRFNSDANIVGRTIRLDDDSYQIVGVLPGDFRFSTPFELWSPLALDPQDEGPKHGIHSLSVIARLRPGVTEQLAQRELEAIRSHFEKITQWGIHFSGEVRVISLHEKLVKNVRRLALLLWGAVGLIMLIACANVTNLLLSHAAVREKELAVRAALGAGRLRLVRQMLTESSLLSCCGGACGLLIAYALVRVLAAVAALPMFGEISRLVVIAVDSRSLCFTLLISVLTGLLISVVPALQLSRPDLQPYLNKGGWRGACSTGMMRQVLMSVEVATAVVLLLVGGLLMRSFVKLLDVNPGFKVEGLLTARISLPYTRYPDRGRRAQFLQQVLQRVSTLPGVQSAGTTNRLPTTASLFAGYLHVEGRPVTTEQQATPVPIGLVSPGYFATMGIPLRAGRAFTDSDDASAPRVVILSESLAQWLFAAENPIGKRVWVPGPGKGTPTVVGVVADVRSQGLDREVRPEVYVPYLQNSMYVTTFVIRTRVNPLSLASAVRSLIQAADPELPLYDVSTMEQRLADSIAPHRLNLLLLGVFALLALLLAAMGVYGVISYLVAQRTHEVGIRVALGARPGNVINMFLLQALGWIIIGVAIGTGVGLAFARFMSALLFEVSPTDPATFAGCTGLLTAVALLACYLPARRAAHLDPIKALRCE